MENQFDSNLDPARERADFEARSSSPVSQSPPGVVTGEMNVMPVASAPDASTHHKGGKRRKRLLTAVIGLVVILGGGAYAAYYFNIWPFAPDPMALKRQALRDAFDKLFIIESSKYTINLDMRVEDRDQAVPSLDAFRPAERGSDESGLSFLSEILTTNLDFIPSNASVTLQFEGEGSLQPSSGSVASRLALSGEANMEGFSMKASGELMLLNNVIFARVNEFPAIPFSSSIDEVRGASSIDAVRGKWIRITADDLADYYSSSGSSITELPFGSMDQSYIARNREASRKLYAIAIEEDVFSVDYSLEDADRSEEHT